MLENCTHKIIVFYKLGATKRDLKKLETYHVLEIVRHRPRFHIFVSKNLNFHDEFGKDQHRYIFNNQRIINNACTLFCLFFYSVHVRTCSELMSIFLMVSINAPWPVGNIFGNRIVSK